MDKKQHIAKLPNAPLQEVIFELLWEMDYDERGIPVDHDFDFAQGVFAELLSNNFKYKKRTIPEDVPFTMYPKTIHQFWKNENEWPVVQLGPGIMVVNEIEKNYSWAKFYILLNNIIEILLKSYKKEMRFVAVSLKYIDAVETGNVSIIDFINENFNISVKNHFSQKTNLVNININETFEVDGVGNLNVLISSGKSPNNEPSIIWQSNVFSRNTYATNDIIGWLDKAHIVASNHFKEITKEKLYATFIDKK